MHKNLWLLPLIVFSQFAGTSLWFAGNAVIGDLPGVSQHVANMTSLVQFGFIAGTLVFSLLSIADRYPAHLVFFFCSLVAAAANGMLIWLAAEQNGVILARCTTGFFLAGIYPVGMKIAADRFPGQLGNALGFLVGALVLGTAFPYILKSYLNFFRWQDILMMTSLLAVAGGCLILFFAAGPLQPRPRTGFSWRTAMRVSEGGRFRAAATGYFGHMWELYTFWAFVPVILTRYNALHSKHLSVPLWSFVIIAAGSIGCAVGGLISRKAGSKTVARFALLISGTCCLLSPWVFGVSTAVFLGFLVVWGISVVADSPQFSTLVAQAAPPQAKGTALTIVTSAGFALTIVSLQLIQSLYAAWPQYAFLALLPGPLIGLIAMRYRAVPARDQ